MTDFWRGRRVLLTGHTGFKGAWMSLWLEGLGAEVTGYALPPAREPNLWGIVAAAAHAGCAPHSVIADIRAAGRVGDPVAPAHPQVLIHIAAQAPGRESHRHPPR